MEINIFESTNSDLDNAIEDDDFKRLPSVIHKELAKKLCELLKENNAFEQYVDNFDIEFWKGWTDSRRSNMLSFCINDAFKWASTPEGEEFWKNIYRKAYKLGNIL